MHARGTGHRTRGPQRCRSCSGKWSNIHELTSPGPGRGRRAAEGREKKRWDGEDPAQAWRLSCVPFLIYLHMVPPDYGANGRRTRPASLPDPPRRSILINYLAAPPGEPASSGRDAGRLVHQQQDDKREAFLCSPPLSALTEQRIRTASLWQKPATSREGWKQRQSTVVYWR